MRLYLTICRVDYKVSFAEIDRLGAHTQPRTHNARFATVGTRLKHLGGKSGPAWSSLKKNVQSRLPMGTSIPGQKGPDALATLKR